MEQTNQLSDALMRTLSAQARSREVELQKAKEAQEAEVEKVLGLETELERARTKTQEYHQAVQRARDLRPLMLHRAEATIRRLEDELGPDRLDALQRLDTCEVELAQAEAKNRQDAATVQELEQAVSHVQTQLDEAKRDIAGLMSRLGLDGPDRLRDLREIFQLKSQSDRLTMEMDEIASRLRVDSESEPGLPE